MIKNIFFILLTTTPLLTSSIAIVKAQQVVTELLPELSTSEPVLMPPKFKSINWEASLYPLVNNMMLANDIHEDSVLLVNTMTNSTNGNLQSRQATATLSSLIPNDSHFRVVRADVLNSARMKLGLSEDDRLESRSKAIGLARYLNAQYVLYSIASGDIKQPDLDMQLMLVQTGEIVWSGKGVAQE
ncbi:penicillin-binding protein activator LpoB [Candidatus Palibaumannia cicadellinicola]|uniref:Penicillin-binding protein activator LpoB n=1 Tax=Candidatus Palibaumannia cicadellinicola TaxID=186490 RepID=A0A2N4XXD8_9GAMM|nr:penicillin-binding protein activator LpoB [Candidatus Baumannia cicadellinicola]PLK59076.1 penicillin-binding protein activator LpoB [Candidatus Baumannia cicadellinicola]